MGKLVRIAALTSIVLSCSGAAAAVVQADEVPADPVNGIWRLYRGGTGDIFIDGKATYLGTVYSEGGVTFDCNHPEGEIIWVLNYLGQVTPPYWSSTLYFYTGTELWYTDDCTPDDTGWAGWSVRRVAGKGYMVMHTRSPSGEKTGTSWLQQVYVANSSAEQRIGSLSKKDVKQFKAMEKELRAVLNCQKVTPKPPPGETPTP